VGIAARTSGTRELAWTVPEDLSGLMFGCTVPGHFALMHGDIVVADET
jgi:azurin